MAKKGSKNVYKLCRGPEKEAITVLYATSAAGDMPPPLILFKYIRILTNVVKELPNEWCYG